MSPEPERRPASGDPREPGSGASDLRGTVELVTYRDPNSLYTVLRIAPEEGYGSPESTLFAPARLTAVGRAAEVEVGQRVHLRGRWGRHPAHGTQFEFEVLEPLPPADEAGLVRYLASKVFEGVGETLARRIVDALGPEALDVIRDHPERLAAVRGLRAEVAERLAATVRAQHASHRTRAFLAGLGLGPLTSQAVVATLGPDCEPAIQGNPYVLARVPGLGFATADRAALGLGFAEDDPRRLAAGLAHALELAADAGHSLASRSALLSRAAALLGEPAPQAAFESALVDLARDDRAVVDERVPGAEEPLVYLPWLRASEAGLAANLARLLREGDPVPLADATALARAEERAELDLDPEQRAAVLHLLATPVGLLTGGPGVGKTTIVRLVASLAERAGAAVALASPTGRAAKRLAEATGREASTVHRLLGFNPQLGGFEHHAEKPLTAGLVIVDEISMLDVALAHHLVKAIRPPTRLVLVGDPNQLPSVGPGNVLGDLIASERVPTARLSRIFRQDAASLIVANAHEILQGRMPELPESARTGADFFFFPAEDPAACAERLVEVVTQRIPGRFGLRWEDDVQVIAPMYRGDCGVDALNERLREALGLGGREVVQGKRRWRVGDRVIHTRNDYEKEVFNGDMGRVVDVSPDGLVTVRYPEQDVVYQGGELSDLRPAFAITVHRSQGGEFPAVVVPLVTQHWMMLQRNLLYTAITRAKRLVVLVGSARALRMAVDNADQARRESALADRLRAAVDALERDAPPH